MAVTITQRPTKSNADLTSKWTAAHNPVIYKFQRRDRTISQVVVSGSQLRLTIGDTTGLTTGTYAYMNTTKYKGGVLIESMTATDIWVSGMTLNGSDGAGYLNETKRNYKIDIKIYEAGSNRLLGASSCVPFTHGTGSKDLSVYVASYLKLINTFSYDVVNKRDTNASIKFYITYQEIWSGGSNDLVSDIANTTYAVNAARQIGDEFGQNMHPYVLTYPNLRPAKFLTKFRRPVYFKGKPFAVGFIYSELVDVQLTKVETHLNINQTQVDIGYTQLDPEQKESVNNLMLDGEYLDSVKFIKLKILSGQPVASSYVYTGYVDEGYTAQI